MLIIINVVIFFGAVLPDLLGVQGLSALLSLNNSPSLQDVVYMCGMVPLEVLQHQRLYTVFTSMFLHADIFHLGGNMLFLYVFGDNVEDAFGHVNYAVFYFLAGIFASFAEIGTLIYFGGDLSSLSIGASGAIAGVLGAYLVLYPRARILTLVFLGFIYILPIPAVVFLGVWFIYQFLLGLIPSGAGIAIGAHVGGFLVGTLFGAARRGRRRRRDL
jgi:membrane associated rhomboid family serine protease